jgi:hypothetical protein
MGTGFVKVGSYHNGKYHGSVKDVKKIQSHLKYIGFRSRERDPDDSIFFNDKTNKADWRDFYKKLENHKALQHSSTVKAHKMIFSLRDKDYQEYKSSGRDYKDAIRKVLEDYEQRKGVKLDWIAVVHNKNDHPHAHVLIRAVSESVQGKSKRIYFSKEDIAEVKKDFNLEIDRHRVRDMERERGKEQHQELDTAIIDLFNDVAKNIERQIKMNERDRERAVEELERKNKRERDR